MKMKKFLAVTTSGVALLFVLTGCSSPQHEAAEGHLDYEHQEAWAQVSGQMQSPIDIVTNSVQPLTEDAGTIVLHYDDRIEHVENNGHSIEVEGEGGAVINGRHFTLSQFHFHAESEHTVNGKHYPLEAHFVNKAQDGRTAVIGVFFEVGNANPGFAQVLDNVKNNTSKLTEIETMIPDNKSYYHYLGSLTTPPLTENVEWYVMEQPLAISAEQLAEFQQYYAHNNREIQPLNDRPVLEHKE